METTNRRLTIFLGIVFLTALLVYSPALENQFVNWDDQEYITENTFIRSLNARLLTESFFGYHSANWHPLTWLSHAADYALWGPNPKGHHLTNILLHALNTLLVAALIVRLMKAVQQRHPTASDRTVVITAAFAGLVFGIHPVHVESVAWVSERKDILCALFFLLTLIFYIRYAAASSGEESNKRPLQQVWHYSAALGSFLLALLSKPMAVTLPLVLLILDWYPLRRFQAGRVGNLLLEKFPFLILSAICSAITILAQRTFGAIRAEAFAPLTTRLTVAPQALLEYLLKIVWPGNLVPIYPYPAGASISSFEFIAAAVMIIAVSALCILKIRNGRVWLATWAYFIVTLLPVLGLIQAGDQYMADRYAYLPSIGPSLLFGLAVAHIAEKMRTHGSPLAARALFLMTVLLVLSVLSYLTIKQIGIWKDSMHLWTYVISKNPDRICVSYNNRGNISYEMGQVDRAVEDYSKALAVNPSCPKTNMNLGILYGRNGQFKKAVFYLTRAVRDDPNDAEAHMNRAVAFGMMGNYGAALDDFDRAISLRADMALAYRYRAVVHDKQDNRAQAQMDLSRACGLGDEESCKAVH